MLDAQSLRKRRLRDKGEGIIQGCAADYRKREKKSKPVEGTAPKKKEPRQLEAEEHSLKQKQTGGERAPKKQNAA